MQIFAKFEKNFLTIDLKSAIRRDAAAVAYVQVAHQPGDSGDHIQLVGDTPAVWDALVVGVCKGCIPYPRRSKIVHSQSWWPSYPVSVLQ